MMQSLYAVSVARSIMIFKIVNNETLISYFDGNL